MKTQGIMGQCASNQLDTLKNVEYPGKKWYNTHRNKIDTVTNVLLDKNDPNNPNPNGDSKPLVTATVAEGGNLSPGGKNPSTCTTALSSSRNSLRGKRVGIGMGLKLYHVSDSPPCLAVRMGLKYLGIESELIDVDFLQAEQASELYKKKNPQGQVPLLDDNGFLLSESVSILQYLADKYKVDESFYPNEPQQRAVINHRLSFYLSTFYKAISEYVLLPICYAYERTENGLKKVNHSVGILEEILERQDGSYVAGKDLTIADLPFIMGTVLLQVIDYDLNPYPKVKSWYINFQSNHGDLWTLANQGLEELTAFEQNPPDFSQFNHPLHPTKSKALTAIQPAPEMQKLDSTSSPNVGANETGPSKAERNNDDAGGEVPEDATE